MIGSSVVGSGRLCSDKHETRCNTSETLYVRGAHSEGLGCEVLRSVPENHLTMEQGWTDIETIGKTGISNDSRRSRAYRGMLNRGGERVRAKGVKWSRKGRQKSGTPSTEGWEKECCGQHDGGLSGPEAHPYGRVPLQPTCSHFRCSRCSGPIPYRCHPGNALR